MGKRKGEGGDRGGRKREGGGKGGGGRKGGGEGERRGGRAEAP